MADVPLKCRCGSVRGVAKNITANSGTRVVCYCNDCQAFPRYLDRESSVLDDFGGTDIYQTTPSQIEITEGSTHIRCLRLSPDGLFRWYTGCCNTPIGNTLSAGMPFIGVIHSFMDDQGSRDQNLGPIRAYVHTKSARSGLPDHYNAKGATLRIILRTICKLFVWKVKGLNKPSPFFDSDGKPISEPQILDQNK